MYLTDYIRLTDYIKMLSNESRIKIREENLKYAYESIAKFENGSINQDIFNMIFDFHYLFTLQLRDYMFAPDYEKFDSFGNQMGDMVGLISLDERNDGRLLALKAIAPHVEDGSYLTFVDGDGNKFSLNYRNGKVVVDGKPIHKRYFNQST